MNYIALSWKIYCLLHNYISIIIIIVESGLNLALSAEEMLQKVYIEQVSSSKTYTKQRSVTKQLN